MPVQDHHHIGCRCKGGDGFASTLAPTHYPPDLSLEPVHNTIALNVDIDGRRVSGSVTTTVIARRAGAQELTLNAVDFDAISTQDPSSAELNHTYDGQKLTIRWAKPFKLGESRKVTITYRVEDPTSGLYFSAPSDTYPDAGYWAATDHETERARHWYPCIDHPNVRVKLDFHLTARADLTILANGKLMGEVPHDDGTKTAHWSLDFPCPSYITCFAIGNFTKAEDGEFKGLPIAYFAAHYHTEENLKRSFGRTGEMLAWMTKKFDLDFPYPKYFQFALPGIGGAMENISLVSWDEIFVLDETLAKEWTWLLDQINVHEMAHSYFGDAVVCRDFAHAWLKESWATYTESLWLEDSKGADELAYDFYRNAQAYFDEADNRYKRPLVTRKFDSSWDMYDRHLYPGGACRIHTLRNELGDEVFFAGVRAYLKKFIGSVVETDDFRRTLEEHSGRPLGQFFDQWIHTADYPSLSVAFEWDDEKKTATFDVTQKQAGDDGKGPVFDFTLEVDYGVDADTLCHRVRIDRATQRFVVPMAKEPDFVSIDPHGRVLHKLDFNPGQPKLVRELEAGTVLGRIHAAHELAKKPTAKNVRLLVDAWKRESFWGVRQQIASALATAKTADAVRALAQMVSEENDPMVIDHVIARARAVHDDALIAAADERLTRGDLPYWAARNAWWTLGLARENAPLERLVEAANARGWAGLVASGAIEALAETRRPEAATTLMALAKPGAAPERNRAAALRAVARLGQFLEKRDQERVAEHLKTFLRDTEVSVQKAAVDALGTLKVTSAIGAIEAFAATLSHQERTGILRTVETMRTPESGRAAASEKELEDLRKHARKLEERIAKLEGEA
ncbi:MAG: M1 family metallopeptidase [bacterium]